MSYNKKCSKWLSFVLRHEPESAGLALDAEGWVDLDLLISKSAFTREEVERAVEMNEKQRFTIKDGRIRANQGHSLEVDLQLTAVEPPEFLYHGTPYHHLALIYMEGIQKMDRQHVHLSADAEVASVVGARRGKPYVLTIEAKLMYAAGHKFYRSANGVWLTDSVPTIFIKEKQCS